MVSYTAVPISHTPLHSQKRNLKETKPSSSGSAKKRKTATRNGGNIVIKGTDSEEKSEGTALDDVPSKRQQIAKGRGKVTERDWHDTRIQGDDDDDYKPSWFP